MTLYEIAQWSSLSLIALSPVAMHLWFAKSTLEAEMYDIMDIILDPAEPDAEKAKNPLKSFAEIARVEDLELSEADIIACLYTAHDATGSQSQPSMLDMMPVDGISNEALELQEESAERRSHNEVESGSHTTEAPESEATLINTQEAELSTDAQELKSKSSESSNAIELKSKDVDEEALIIDDHVNIQDDASTQITSNTSATSTTSKLRVETEASPGEICDEQLKLNELAALKAQQAEVARKMSKIQLVMKNTENAEDVANLQLEVNALKKVLRPLSKKIQSSSDELREAGIQVAAKSTKSTVEQVSSEPQKRVCEQVEARSVTKSDESTSLSEVGAVSSAGNEELKVDELTALKAQQAEVAQKMSKMQLVMKNTKDADEFVRLQLKVKALKKELCLLVQAERVNSMGSQLELNVSKTEPSEPRSVSQSTSSTAASTTPKVSLSSAEIQELQKRRKKLYYKQSSVDKELRELRDTLATETESASHGVPGGELLETGMLQKRIDKRLEESKSIAREVTILVNQLRETGVETSKKAAKRARQKKRRKEFKRQEAVKLAAEAENTEVDQEELRSISSDKMVEELKLLLENGSEAVEELQETPDMTPQQRRTLTRERLRAKESQAAAKRLESRLTDGNNSETNDGQSQHDSADEESGLLHAKDRADCGKRSRVRHLDVVLELRARSGSRLV